MKITITVYRASDDYLYKEMTDTIFPTGTSKINPLNYLEDGYTTFTTAVSFPNKFYKEKLTFPNYADYFLTDIYYRIPFEQFDIAVDSLYTDIPDGTGAMTLYNAADIFPNLTSNKNNIVLKLKTFKRGENYGISLANPLFVNPNTLQMADTPLSGYVATYNLYYPINQSEELQGLKVGFKIESFENSSNSNMNVYSIGNSQNYARNSVNIDNAIKNCERYAHNAENEAFDLWRDEQYEESDKRLAESEGMKRTTKS